jgi:hypothetical protein
MIVVDFGCYTGKIHHDHGVAEQGWSRVPGLGGRSELR